MTVPFLENRSRYNIVTFQLGWTYHKMSSGGLTGERPRTAALSEDNLDPVAVAGRADYTSLVKGGVYYLNAKYKRPIIVEAVDKASAGTLTSVQSVKFTDVAAVIRDLLPLINATPFVPFKLAPGEMIKAVTTGTTLGFLMRFDSEETPL